MKSHVNPGALPLLYMMALGITFDHWLLASVQSLICRDVTCFICCLGGLIQYTAIPWIVSILIRLCFTHSGALSPNQKVFKSSSPWSQGGREICLLFHITSELQVSWSGSCGHSQSLRHIPQNSLSPLL